QTDQVLESGLQVMASHLRLFHLGVAPENTRMMSGDLQRRHHAPQFALAQGVNSAQEKPGNESMLLGFRALDPCHTCYLRYCVGWGPFSSVSVPDGAFACVVGEFEILGQFQRVRRARVLAKTAEHAAAQIVGEGGKFLAPGLLVTFAGNYNQVLRTCESAQVACDAHGLVRIRIDVQPWRATVPFRHLGTLQRILFGIDLFRVLVAESNAQTLNQVEQEDLAKQAWDAHKAKEYH